MLSLSFQKEPKMSFAITILIKYVGSENTDSVCYVARCWISIVKSAAENQTQYAQS